LTSEVKNELDIDLKTFKRLLKMIESTIEDRDLAYVTIKNMNMTDIYHMLFLKLLFFTERVSYSAYFDLPYNTETWESLTTHNIVRNISKDKSAYKNNYKLIYKKLIYNPSFHPNIDDINKNNKKW
jgi:hypothetical protein